MGGDGTHTVAKPELVHEMFEGTIVATRQSAGQNCAGRSSRRFKSVAILDDEIPRVRCCDIPQPMRLTSHTRVARDPWAMMCTALVYAAAELL